MGIDQYFSGMESAKAMGGGQYFKGEGKFKLITKRLFKYEGHKGVFFIAEFDVLESTSATDPVGSTRSWCTPLTGDRVKYSFSDMKNLVFALTGQEPKDVGEPAENPSLHKEATELVKAAVDAEYAKKKDIDPLELIGAEVVLETNSKQTKKGGTFTVHTWSPVPAQAPLAAAG